MTPEDVILATRTIWGEARSESYEGKVAVAWVMKNRFSGRHRRENTMAGVVTEPYQFSCWLDNDPNKDKLETVGPNDEQFLESMKAFLEAWTGTDDPTFGATHYHTASIDPNWSVGKTPVVKVGAHLFYNDID